MNKDNLLKLNLQHFAGISDQPLTFGMADFTFGRGANAVHFDGKEELQHEGGELTLTPVYAEITTEDFGETVVDEVLTGFEGELSITAFSSTLKTMELALQSTEQVVDSETSEVIGLTDARLGTRARDKAVPVTIHPRIMGDDHSLDIHIYKMASTGEFNRTFGNEQGNVPATFKMYPRDGMDANSPGNFFFIGLETDDPNYVVPAPGA